MLASTFITLSLLSLNEAKKPSGKVQISPVMIVAAAKEIIPECKFNDVQLKAFAKKSKSYYNFSGCALTSREIPNGSFVVGSNFAYADVKLDNPKNITMDGTKWDHGQLRLYGKVQGVNLDKSIWNSGFLYIDKPSAYKPPVGTAPATRFGVSLKGAIFRKSGLNTLDAKDINLESAEFTQSFLTFFCIGEVLARNSIFKNTNFVEGTVKSSFPSYCNFQAWGSQFVNNSMVYINATSLRRSQMAKAIGNATTGMFITNKNGDKIILNNFNH